MNNQTKNKGWIAIHRKLLENPITSKPDYLSVWVHLLLMANHKETSFIWNNQKQILKEGQLLTGLKVLSKKTGVAQGTVYRILNYLENEKQIEQQKTTKFTIITIVNWSKYQRNEKQNEKQIENRLKTDEKQIETYNNDNNVNNKYICSFDTFWENYPRKIGKRKANEKYIHLATSKQKEQEILEGLEQYLGKWKLEKTNLEYIPHPTTWLNQARWEDEVMVNRDVYNDFARKNENDWKQIKEKSSDPLVDDNGEMVKLSDILNKYSKKQ